MPPPYIDAKTGRQDEMNATEHLDHIYQIHVS